MTSAGRLSQVSAAAATLQRRHLHLSAAVCRIPAFHRKRYRRTLAPPYHQVRYADEDPSAATRPALPLDGSLATTRTTPAQELRSAMLSRRSLPGKLFELSESEANLWCRRVTLPLAHPGCLPLAQAVCRANVEPRLHLAGSGGGAAVAAAAAAAAAAADAGGAVAAAAGAASASAPSSTPSATARLSGEQRGAIVSAAVAAVRAVESQHRWPEQPGPRASGRLQQRRICAVMESLLLACARAGALQSPEDLQADETPFVQMFAKYSGLHASASKRLLLPDLASMRTNRFLIRAPLAWQLRARCPLRPLAPQVGVRPPPPDWPYNPDLLGLGPEEDFWHFGESRKTVHYVAGERVLRAVPGHVTDDPWLPGDPCEFALLLAVNGDDTAGAEEPPIDFARPENWPALTCDALLRLYASTAAQAFNRGFNWVTDLRLGDRPFATQAATFVGDRLKLSAFQLATVGGGGDSAGDDGDGGASVHVTNQMWTQPEPVLLWQRDPASGRVTDANPEQLLRLADLVCAPRVPREEAADSRPFLDGEPPCSRRAWIGAAYEPPAPPPRPSRPFPRTYNHMYLLDPVQPHSLYREMRSHPHFPRLPDKFEARVAAWRLKREHVRLGRRKVVRKPYLVSDTFP